MEYYSYVDDLRYKVCGNQHYVHINGWCFREDGTELSFYAQIDEKKVPLEIIQFEREDVLLKYKKSFSNKKIGFSIKIDLLETNFNTIDLCVEGNDKYTILSKSFNDLKKLNDGYPFEYSIDVCSPEENECNILGWMYSINGEDLKISIVDTLGNECDSVTHWAFRQDVGMLFDLDESQYCCGFATNFKYNGNGKYKLKVEDSQGEYLLNISNRKGIKTLTKEYIKNLNSENVKKAINYLKTNGVKKFVTRLSMGAGKKKLSYQEWFDLHTPSLEELQRQRKYEFNYNPKISLIVATYNTPEEFLKEMIESVCNQTYLNWELCIADGSDNLKVQEYVQEHYGNNSKIKFIKLKENYGISGNMNAALELATGDYVGLYDHDDMLTIDALFEVVKSLQEKEYDIVYSDEDKYLNETQELVDPHFKPDFNLDLMRSVNYICHFFVVKKSLIDQVGNFNKEYDGAQDYDFMLRCIEATTANQIHHIAKILYHWRMHSLSTASNPESKMYAFEAGKNAIQAHLDRLKIQAEAEMHDYLGLYRVKYKVQGEPLISILIPNKDHIDDLKRCIDSIGKSTYSNYEIIVIENNSEYKETFDFYKELEKENEKVKVVIWNKEFNYSVINNYGTKYANGEYLLLLNNDTEIINTDCLEEMLSVCQREDVGIVGARLCYDDNTIQHAGVIVGFGGIAGHSFVGNEKDEPGYFGRQVVTQDLSAVTAACLMVKKEVFDKVNGLNEELKVAFNDIDFCLKVRDLGYLVVYDPYAQLYHFESKSRGSEDSFEKVQRFNNEIQTFRERWAGILENGDPYYNPNLTYMGESYTLKDKN